MAEVINPPTWIAWWSVQRALTVAVVGSGGLGAAMRGLPLAGDVAAWAGIAALWALAWWTLRQVGWLFNLPLVLGDTAVRQMILGKPTMRVRAWAGHGRRFELQELRATWHPPGQGAPQPLALDMPDHLHYVGPITLTVLLPELPVGEVEVDLTVVSGAELFHANRRYDLASLQTGPLAVVMTRSGTQWDWQREHWDRTQHG